MNDYGELDAQDIMVLVPASMFPSEPGEPLGEEGETFLRKMADTFSCWPLDFGENIETHLEVWFVRDPNADHAKEMCESFIRRGGDV